MIYRYKNITRIPTSLNSPECLASLEAIVNANATDRSRLINNTFYNSASVHLELNRIYNKKCAYCEAPEDEPEIEHYRPKGRLTGRRHGGYYWLCYEWSNLLPACHDCNKSGAKGNYFPILGTPADIIRNGNLPDTEENLITSQNLLIQEVPLLLNPEIPGFDPFDYFEFNEFGFLNIKTGLNSTSRKFERAKNSIHTYELNRYKLEIQYRMVEIRRIYKIVKLLFLQKLNGEITDVGFRRQYFTLLSEIKSKSNPTKPYSFFWDFVFKNFNQIYITSFFKGRQRSFFFELTNEFKNIYA